MSLQQSFTRRRRAHDRSDRGPTVPRPHDGDRASPLAESSEPYNLALGRLAKCIWVLSAFLAAAIAHFIVDGLTAGGGTALVITLVLLAILISLWRQGTRLKADRAPTRRS
jgi:hypothetical protein